MNIRIHENAVTETEEAAVYLKGMSDGLRISGNDEQAESLLAASEWMRKLSQNICGQGFIGCRGGVECGSDHK